MSFRVELMAYGSSQARGRIRATAAGLSHSRSNTGYELHLWLAPQLTAMRPTKWGQGSNLHPQGSQSGSLLLSHDRNSQSQWTLQSSSERTPGNKSIVLMTWYTSGSALESLSYLKTLWLRKPVNSHYCLSQVELGFLVLCQRLLELKHDYSYIKYINEHFRVDVPGVQFVFYI